MFHVAKPDIANAAAAETFVVEFEKNSLVIEPSAENTISESDIIIEIIITNKTRVTILDFEGKVFCNSKGFE